MTVPVHPTPDLRDRLVTALGNVRLRLGPNALAMIGRGEAIRLSGNEKDDVADAVLGVFRSELDQLDFLRAAVDLIRRADIFSEEILLCLDGDRVSINVNVSDVFAWGGGDAEEITPERLPVLEQAWRDCRAVDADEWIVELYAARVRGMRPQGAAYPKEPGIAALFDACGPERPIGLGNPRKPPALETVDLTPKPCPRQCEHDPHTWPAEHPEYQCAGDLTYTTTKET